MAKATPESLVKRAIKAELEALVSAGYPVWYFMPVPGRLSAPGIPDFICCVNGFFLAIEAKADSGRTTLIQEITITRINAANGRALVVTGTKLENLIAQLSNLAGRPK